MQVFCCDFAEIKDNHADISIKSESQVQCHDILSKSPGKSPVLSRQIEGRNVDKEN